MTAGNDLDYVIVGGGLQGCLLAHAIAHHQPIARVLLVEKSDKLCGNHTWSFHATDIPLKTRPWLQPLVTKTWPGYIVKFPGLSRRLAIPYETITAESLRSATLSLASSQSNQAVNSPLEIVCGQSCEIVSRKQVQIGKNRRIDCTTVIDCRGSEASSTRQNGVGYQSFIGYEYQTDRPWPASEPTLMDVRADQACGFEFLYELPFGPHRVLLEYTRFSEEPTCDESRAQCLIAERLAEAGIEARELVRSEQGCLPMPYRTPQANQETTVAGGYAGGWYHAATGYSMPLAVRFADIVSRTEPSAISEAVNDAAARDSLRRGFTRFLNRLLFCLVKPEKRWQIFRRFYRVLSEKQISRFYSHRFSVADAARIVIGCPPSGLAPLRFTKSFSTRTDPGLI